MPARKEWKKIYAALMGKLRLPCRLRFSEDVKIGRHEFEDDGTCSIIVNLTADFHIPEHLILHEAAHHRICEPYRDVICGFAPFDDGLNGEWCHMGQGGHCEHWAETLCDMYKETGTLLPRGTTFAKFAKAAGIEHRNFVREQKAVVGDEVRWLEDLWILK